MLDNPKYDKPDMSQKCQDYLKWLVQEYDIKEILEFGSGGSTFMFAKLVEQIQSREHDTNFYNRIKDKIPKNVNLIKHLSYYEQITKLHEFIFIDGIKRIECMKNAVLKSPLIVIHDSERDEYKPGFDYIESYGYKDISPEGINIKVYFHGNLDNFIRLRESSPQDDS